MKYCPLCGAEYLEGRLSCANCGATLVDVQSAKNDNPTKLLWAGRDSVEFDLVAHALREAEIPAKADVALGGLIGSLLHSESKIYVLSSDFDRALDIAAKAIAAREIGRAATQLCHACTKECSASLAVCPTCKAPLIIEPAKDQETLPATASNSLTGRKYCPLCDAAYADDHTRCSVCGVDLVPEEQRGRPLSERERNERLEAIWRGGDPLAVSEVITALREAGIRHHVQPTNDHLVFELAMPRPKYLVRVFASDAARARELISGIREIPLFGGRDELDEAEAPAVRRKTERKWNPAAATQEVWGGQDAALADFLEECLRENRIGVRRAGREPGLLRLYVMQNDEAAAREIVRELLESSPPV